MTNEKPAPRVIRRGDDPSEETRVIREDEGNSEVYSATLSTGRLVAMREITAGDLLYLEKSLSAAGDMERSLKLAARISTGEGRLSYEDLQRMKMRDIKVVTELLAKAGGTEDEDMDEFPND